mmetsp:Transcript_34295/g.43294  ORF Transcript_34295/g.43294 Transcript_34295/m.43294 type:complete len:86 (-) Transcript_34295:765-1022(-)
MKVNIIAKGQITRVEKNAIFLISFSVENIVPRNQDMKQKATMSICAVQSISVGRPVLCPLVIRSVAFQLMWSTGAVAKSPINART